MRAEPLRQCTSASHSDWHVSDGDLGIVKIIINSFYIRQDRFYMRASRRVAQGKESAPYRRPMYQ